MGEVVFQLLYKHKAWNIDTQYMGVEEMRWMNSLCIHEKEREAFQRTGAFWGEKKNVTETQMTLEGFCPLTL